MDQPNAFGSAGIIVLGDSTYPLSVLSITDIADTMAWAKQQLRHPMEIAKEARDILRPIGKVPVKPVMQKPIKDMKTDERLAWRQKVSEYEAANDQWLTEQAEFARLSEVLVLDAKDDMANPNSLDKKAAHALMRSLKGMSYMVWLSIRRKSPNVKFEEIETEIGKVSVKEIEHIVNSINSVDPELLEEMEAKKPPEGEGQ